MNTSIQWFDTHFHPDLIKKPIQEIVDAAEKNSVTKMVAINTDPDQFESLEALAQSCHIPLTIGLHPVDVNQKINNTDDLTRLKSLLRAHVHKQHVVGIGETGMDFYHKPYVQLYQEASFHLHCKIALEYDLPIVVHTRLAEPETWNVLKQYPTAKIIMHSFTSSMWLAQKVLEAGHTISFSGIVTFKNAQDLRDVLAITPLNQMIIETDSPYLSPEPLRGQSNQPAHVMHTGLFIAKYLNIDAVQLSKVIYENSMRIFSRIN